MNILGSELKTTLQLWNKTFRTYGDICKFQPNIRSYSSVNINEITKITNNINSNDSGKSIEDLAKEIAKDDMPVEMVNPYERDRKVCVLCKYGVKLDYKNPKLLSQFVSPYTGKLYDQHITRLCTKQQELLEKEIKKSVQAAQMPVQVKSVEFLKDPQLYDPNNPIKPHKY